MEGPVNTDKDEFKLSNNKIIYTHKINNYSISNHEEPIKDTTEMLSLE